MTPFRPNKNVTYVGDHRRAVGGLWPEIGHLQIQWLLRHWLLPKHVLLDLACGSLRLGVYAIPYLNPGNYLGIDQHEGLIQDGIHEELGLDVYESQRPEFVVSSEFELDKFTKRPDYVMIQSLFTHLTPEDIQRCLKELHGVATPQTKIFATFRDPSQTTRHNDTQSHMHGFFCYSVADIRQFGKDLFDVHYIGDWKHPRRQVMVAYTKKTSATKPWWTTRGRKA